MFILNPPWTLEPMLRELMPELVRLLGADEGAGFVLESGEPVSLGSRPRAATRSDADLTTRDPRMDTESRSAPEGGRTRARPGSRPASQPASPDRPRSRPRTRS
jgi:23S rRNA (adenine2030-N6)-methyltransferase